MKLNRHILQHALDMAAKTSLPTTIILHRAADIGLTYHTLRAAVMLEGKRFGKDLFPDMGRPVATALPPRWFVVDVPIELV